MTTRKTFDGKPNVEKDLSRRAFLGVAAATAVSVPGIVRADGAKRVFKVGLVGCGGRGCNWFGGKCAGGAIRDITVAAQRLGHDVQLVAAADYFRDKALDVCRKYGVDEKMAFGGADGYRKVIETDCEIVLLCAPPVFRPLHAAACVAAGKHIFAEKPIAADPRGLRAFLKTVADAKAKNLSILSGTLHRHSNRFLKQIGPVRNGAIGKIVAGRVYRCHGPIWNRPRRPEDTNASYLCNNWYHFWEMSGDQITEQAIHEVDLANWFIGRFPVRAFGMGGRWRRPAGDIYDSIAIDFDYDNGLHVATYGRQMPGCANLVGTRLVGTEGEVSLGGKFSRYDGKPVAEDLAAIAGRDDNGLVMEHADFLEGILSGNLLNEGEQVAMSTATTMMGTLAAYTGRQVKMLDLLQNEKSEFYNGHNAAFLPEDFEGSADIPLPPEGQPPMPGADA